jgi:hypothetical protein
MTLSQKLADVLDTIQPDVLPFLASVQDGRHELSLELTAAGPVGLAFDALNFSAPATPELNAEALRAWADRLAARVTYLMEPLVVVELDPVAGEAELRSQSPTARGDLNAYYEIRLNTSGVLRLSRVVFDAATRRRRPAPCQLTREVLERLTDDLVACAC